MGGSAAPKAGAGDPLRVLGQWREDERSKACELLRASPKLASARQARRVVFRSERLQPALLAEAAMRIYLHAKTGRCGQRQR